MGYSKLLGRGKIDKAITKKKQQQKKQRHTILLNTTYKTEDLITRTPQNTWDDLTCSGRVNYSMLK